MKKNRDCSKKSHMTRMNVPKHRFGTVHARGANRTQSQEWKLLWPFREEHGTSQSEPDWAEVARTNKKELKLFLESPCTHWNSGFRIKSTSLWADANVYASHARGDAVKCVWFRHGPQFLQESRKPRWTLVSRTGVEDKEANQMSYTDDKRNAKLLWYIYRKLGPKWTVPHVYS